MSWLDSKKNIRPDDYRYHWVRKLEIECGCGKKHVFVRQKTEEDKKKASKEIVDLKTKEEEKK